MKILRIPLVAAALAMGMLVAQLPDAGGSLRGRVLDGRDQPIEGATLVLRAGSSRQPLLTISGRDGSYLYSNLKLDVDYEVDARHEGLASLTRTLRISNAGEKVGMDLVLGPRIQFQEAGAASGLNFVLRNGATGHRYQPEIMIAGVAALDYNNDGCMDIFFTNGAAIPGPEKDRPEFSNRLYPQQLRYDVYRCHRGSRAGGRRLFHGSRRRPTSITMASPTSSSPGVTAIRSIAIAETAVSRTSPRMRAWRRRQAEAWAVSAGWLDYDNDGWLDLFVTNYVAWDPAHGALAAEPGTAVLLPSHAYIAACPTSSSTTITTAPLPMSRERPESAASIGKGMGVAFARFRRRRAAPISSWPTIPYRNFLFQQSGRRHVPGSRT